MCKQFWRLAKFILRLVKISIGGELAALFVRIMQKDQMGCGNVRLIYICSLVTHFFVSKCH